MLPLTLAEVTFSELDASFWRAVTLMTLLDTVRAAPVDEVPASTPKVAGPASACVEDTAPSADWPLTTAAEGAAMLVALTASSLVALLVLALALTELPVTVSVPPVIVVPMFAPVRAGVAVTVVRPRAFCRLLTEKSVLTVLVVLGVS